MIQPDEIIRSNRKTLSISVDAYARLIVRAPKRCGQERIFAFLREKESWILKKQAERKGVGMSLPPENLDGYSFLLIGKDTVIRLTDGTRIRYDSLQNVIELPREKGREGLVKWLQENARRILSAVTEEQAARMGTSYKSVSITKARSRWGSCSVENALRYTFRLLYCPKEVVEYVVVHELAHTRHKNHSKAFWSEVESFVPDWKARRQWLKLHGILTEIF